MRLGVVDLFAGAGGFSAGFRDAGYEIIAAVESVPQYANTHKLNFPNSDIFQIDIRELELDALHESVKSKGTFDHIVVIGGPPCQSFSIIGRPKINSLKVTQGTFQNDDRDYLFKDFFRVVELLRPSAFIMENVPEIRSKQQGTLFKECLKIAHELGYWTNFDIVNAVNFGVPQNRRRMFLVGTKERNFAFPMPTHKDLDIEQENLLNFENKKKRLITVGDAILDLPEIYDGIRAGHLPYREIKEINQYQKLMRNQGGTVGNNICRMSNDRAKKIFSYLSPGQKYMDLEPEIRKILPFREDIFADRLKRLHPDKPSWTIIAHIGMDGYMYIHPTENRTLSVREAARIQSFHDSFEFCGNMREQYIQVGNAVAPLLAMQIAKSLNETFISRDLAA